jgi:hypothetical protein
LFDHGPRRSSRSSKTASHMGSCRSTSGSRKTRRAAKLGTSSKCARVAGRGRERHNLFALRRAARPSRRVHAVHSVGRTRRQAGGLPPECRRSAGSRLRGLPELTVRTGRQAVSRTPVSSPHTQREQTWQSSALDIKPIRGLEADVGKARRRPTRSAACSDAAVEPNRPRPDRVDPVSVVADEQLEGAPGGCRGGLATDALWRRRRTRRALRGPRGLQRFAKNELGSYCFVRVSVAVV